MGGEIHILLMIRIVLRYDVDSLFDTYDGILDALLWTTHITNQYQEVKSKMNRK